MLAPMAAWFCSPSSRPSPRGEGETFPLGLAKREWVRFGRNAWHACGLPKGAKGDLGEAILAAGFINLLLELWHGFQKLHVSGKHEFYRRENAERRGQEGIISRGDVKAQHGKAATKTKPRNLNREINERHERQKDGTISRGDAPPPVNLRRTGRQAGNARAQRILARILSHGLNTEETRIKNPNCG